MSENRPEAINILGVQVHPYTVAQLHEALADIIDEDRRALVLHANVHGLNLTAQNPWMRDLLNGAEIVFCDGAGVILGARILGHHIPERITYADWMWQLGEFAAARGYTLYFLGARPGVALRAADRLVERFPALKIVGVRDGYFAKESGHPENEAVLSDISRARPNILIVGMGMPLQEQWLRDNQERIEANVTLSAGAAFDYISGELQRAPTWMTDHGLEWLGRLIIDPRRLWQRYLVGNPVFLARIMRDYLFNRR